MDRRGFLVTTGAAAIASTTARAEPPVLPGAKRLRLASASWHGDGIGSGAERLAWRITTATSGRYRIEIAADASGADLTYGPVNFSLHPAFAVFAGLPFGQGLDSAAHATWLANGGGQMLWDELVAGFGLKPLIAGRSGPSSGIWASTRLEDAADFAGMHVHVAGFAADVVKVLGGTPVQVPPQDLKAALADGRVQAAEWLGPLAAASSDLQPLTERHYQPGFNPTGLMLVLNLPLNIWAAMDPADRAIFEACAAQEYQLSVADAHAQALLDRQVQPAAKWPVRLPLPPRLGRALASAAAEMVARMASVDGDTRRVCDSHQAFRALFEAAPPAI